MTKDIYLRNHEIISSLVENHFSLKKDSLNTFKENLFRGTIADYRILEQLDENYRLEKDLTIEDLERIDASWRMFKFKFGEFCADTGITYRDYFYNKGPFLKSKISKELIHYYENNTTYFYENYRPFFVKDLVNDFLTEINDFRLPKKKLKVVLSFNLSDMFLCSSGQNWSSCLNLESSYHGCYWTGLASIPFDPNRGMIYIGAKGNNSTTSCFGIQGDKMFFRTFVLLDQRLNLNLLKWYPVDFRSNDILNLLNHKFDAFNIKHINEDFVSFQPVNNLPELDMEREKRELYIYQDKTFVSDEDRYIRFDGGKIHQSFLNDQTFSGPFINCEGGLVHLVEENTELKHFVDNTECICSACGETGNRRRFREVEGRLLCNNCFENYAAYCEACDEYYLEDHFNFDVGLCEECAFEQGEAV